ncbi:MAG: recombinase family protein [Defluviitaleaceae bacterium]|nr:recombinase family protein [Defluviitaleaceae bacterium]
MNKYERMNQERMLVETKKRIAAYCRVSTDRDDQANSFESQQKYFKDYIERMPDWELCEIFADKGTTGTNTKKRKEFHRMIACAKHGDFDLIITKEISRFARNTLDSIHHTRELKKHGVGVIFLNDNINTLDPDAELRLTIMSSIAQEESRKTSERVKWGQKRRMEQGVVFGRDMLGYDVRKGQMFINQEGAKLVKLIFEKFAHENKGSHTIARELREAGHKTITGNSHWTNSVIFKIIRNEKYCGDLVQKKTITPDYLSHEKKYNHGEEEFVIIKDHHEPIISRELFDEANRILDERALSAEGKSKHSNRYAFSGKIKCGTCENSYVARYKIRKDESVYKAWRCIEGARNGSPQIDKAGNQIGCSSPSIRNEDALHVMSLVMNNLEIEKNSIVKNVAHIIQKVTSRGNIVYDADKMQEQIKKVEDKKARLLELYMSKDIDKNDFITARNKCDLEIDKLNEILKSIDKRDSIIKHQSQLLKDITSAVDELISNNDIHNEIFFRNILDRMIIQSKNHIDVYLKLLPHKWSYELSKAIQVTDSISTKKNDVRLSQESEENVGHFTTRCRNRGVGPPGNDRHYMPSANRQGYSGTNA